MNCTLLPLQLSTDMPYLQGLLNAFVQLEIPGINAAAPFAGLCDT